MEGCHNSELGGGHFGRDKTLAKISERYYWLGMVKDVQEYCRSCDQCQRANRFEADLRVTSILMMGKYYLTGSLTNLVLSFT